MYILLLSNFFQIIHVAIIDFLYSYFLSVALLVVDGLMKIAICGLQRFAHCPNFQFLDPLTQMLLLLVLIGRVVPPNQMLVLLMLIESVVPLY